MTKLQASMKESSMRRQSVALSRVAYKIGSYFKACENCSQKEEIELDSGKVVVRYLSGYQVFRAYSPKSAGFSYWCYECGAKDLKCWDGALDIGMDAIVGSRDSVAKRKMVLRKEAVRMETKARVPSRAEEIARLEGELAKLMGMLKNQ